MAVVLGTGPLWDSDVSSRAANAGVVLASRHVQRKALTMSVPLSILDLAVIGKGETVSDRLEGSTAMAQRAEELGYRRIWYAEHHNNPAIASSATSVLIAHIAAHTQTIRLGAGGIMLPNHSPLTIAEQFGTLETLHPGRIDLGLGRAAGLGHRLPTQ